MAGEEVGEVGLLYPDGLRVLFERTGTDDGQELVARGSDLTRDARALPRERGSEGVPNQSERLVVAHSERLKLGLRH